MAARKNPITDELEVDHALVGAVRQAAQKRAVREPAWQTLLDEYTPSELMLIIGRSTTPRGAIWQAAQAVKEIKTRGRRHFVHDGAQMDTAIAVTIAAAEFEQGCRARTWNHRVPFSIWLTRQPLALPAPAAPKPARKRDYKAEAARRKQLKAARQLQTV